MHIRLVAPGLFWPGPSPSQMPVAEPGLDSAPLPSLAALLARAKECGTTHGEASSAFASTLGFSSGAAAMRAAADGLAPEPGEHWLCADPVNVAFIGEHPVLNPPQALAIGDRDAEELKAALTPALAPYGDFHLPTPTRGYLRLKRATRIEFAPLADVAGRPLSYFLPEGADERLWLRAAGEVETTLHGAPLNARREADGAPAINKLWFWGLAEVPHPSPAPPLVVTDSLAGRGAAALAGAPALPLADLDQALNAGRGEIAILIDELEEPLLFRDGRAWLAALSRLESTLFTPLRDALRRGERISISAPLREGGPELSLSRHRLQFWRRPQPLSRQLFRTRTR